MRTAKSTLALIASLALAATGCASDGLWRKYGSHEAHGGGVRIAQRAAEGTSLEVRVHYHGTRHAARSATTPPIEDPSGCGDTTFLFHTRDYGTDGLSRVGPDFTRRGPIYTPEVPFDDRRTPRRCVVFAYLSREQDANRVTLRTYAGGEPPVSWIEVGATSGIHPAFFVLVPATAAIDLVTLPIQLLLILAVGMNATL